MKNESFKLKNTNTLSIASSMIANANKNSRSPRKT